MVKLYLCLSGGFTQFPTHVKLCPRVSPWWNSFILSPMQKVKFCWCGDVFNVHETLMKPPLRLTLSWLGPFMADLGAQTLFFCWLHPIRHIITWHSLPYNILWLLIYYILYLLLLHIYYHGKSIYEYNHIKVHIIKIKMMVKLVVKITKFESWYMCVPC
jgi:hypothetical protein